MAQPIAESRIASIGSYRLYIEPSGKLFVNTGTVKLRVTPEEARELLDYMLTFARYFEQTEPVTGELAHANGRNA
jgi:hypothetical protein